MNALSQETLRLLGLHEPDAQAPGEDQPAPSTTDLRHLIQIVDLLESNRMPVPAGEVKRALVEIGDLRNAARRLHDSKKELGDSLAALDRADDAHMRQLIAWQGIDWNAADRSERMKRRDQEATLKFDIESARRRLLAAVRAHVAVRQPTLPTLRTADLRALEPAPPRDWLNPES